MSDKKTFFKCNLCFPPEGDRYLIWMNGVPLRVMHTKRHAEELVIKLKRSNDAPKFAWNYEITTVSDKLIDHLVTPEPVPVSLQES